MRTPCTILLLIAGSSALALGAPSPTPQPSPQPSASPSPAPVVHSTFKLPPNSRNPFWPVGWTKPAPVAAASATPTPNVIPPLDPKEFVLTSISLQPSKIAIINQVSCMEGDLLKWKGGKARVLQIRDGSVVLRNEVNEIVVSIRTQ